VAEADDDEALLLGEDGLVHRPTRVQMQKQVRHLLPPPVGSSSLDFSPTGYLVTKCEGDAMRVTPYSIYRSR
jgi:hypothetical protein